MPMNALNSHNQTERPPLRNYQVAGVKAMLSAKRFMLCDEPGVAKTRQLIEAAIRTGYTDRPHLVVVGLKVAMGVWQDQIETWSNAESFVYEGNVAQRKKILESLQRKIKDGQFPEFIIVSSGLFKELYSKIYFGAVIFDEYHKMGLCNRKSKFFKEVKEALNGHRYAHYVFMATGTPILDTPDDLWPVLNILYPRDFRGYWNFVEEFCTVKDSFNGYKTIERKPKDVEGLHKVLSGRYLRRKLQVVAPEIQEPIRTFIPIKLEEPLRSIYKQFQSELMIALGDNFIITPNKITNLIRLRQLLVSPQVLGGADNYEVPLGQLIPEVISYASDEWQRNKPTVIFTPFRAGVEIIEREVLKYFNSRGEAVSVFTIMGGGGSEQQKVAQEFQASTAKKKVLIGTIKSAASYTATTSDIILFAGGEYSAVEMQQAEGRIKRLTQNNVCRFVYFYHRGTMEAALFRTVKEKGYWADVTLTAKDILLKD